MDCGGQSDAPRWSSNFSLSEAPHWPLPDTLKRELQLPKAPSSLRAAGAVQKTPGEGAALAHVGPFQKLPHSPAVMKSENLHSHRDHACNVPRDL